MLWLKIRNAKNLKVKYQQSAVKLKFSIGKKTILHKILQKFFYHFFIQQNIIIRNYFHIFPRTSDNEVVVVNLCLIMEIDSTIFSNKQYCYKQIQALFSIIHFSPIYTLKTKMAPLSSIINHKHQTRYIRL